MYVRLVFLVALLGTCWQCRAGTADGRVKKLKSLESAAKDKIVVFSSSNFDEFAVSSSRPYSLVFFCSAGAKLDSPKLQLRNLRKEYALAAAAFKRGPDADRVFFVELNFETSKELFQRLGITGLPFLFVWDTTSSLGTKAGRKATIPDSKKCGLNVPKYPWPAEDLVKCVEERSGQKAGAVDRPSFVKNPLFPVVAVAFLGTGAYVAWKVYNSPIVRITGLWTAGALLVFWFSTSGGMYNIIRGMPLMSPGKDGKIMWWLEGRGGQLGAEGFVMGSSYMVFSGLMSALVYVVPKIKDDTLRSTTSIVLLLVTIFVSNVIVNAYYTKTSLRMRSFFFA